MRTPFVAANWKMFKTIGEAVSYAKEFRRFVEGASGIEIVIAPPFTAINRVAEALQGTGIGVAGQDLYWEVQGAFTGEVSGAMLKEAGAGYVIIGHSERRTLFGETDAGVNRKVRAANAAGLVPIVCIGETLEQRENGQTTSVLDRQIADGLEGLGPADVERLVVAYEPVWAIGTGRNATAEQAEEAHAHVRRRLAERFGAGFAEACRVIYGGSVKPGNIREIASQPDVDGALVGGASLDPEAFAAIVAGTRAPAV